MIDAYVPLHVGFILFLSLLLLGDFIEFVSLTIDWSETYNGRQDCARSVSMS